MSDLYALTFTASGLVHDSAGNVVGQQDITETITVTEAEARALIEGVTP